MRAVKGHTKRNDALEIPHGLEDPSLLMRQMTEQSFDCIPFVPEYRDGYRSNGPFAYEPCFERFLISTHGAFT